MSGEVFERDKAIRFHHCDPAGIVFYPQYFVLFNELVEDWFDAALALPFARLHGEARLGIPMRRLECDFLAPSRVGDVLAMRLRVASIGRTSVTLRIEAASGGHPRLGATLVVVLASLDSGRPVELPETLRTAIARYAE